MGDAGLAVPGHAVLGRGADEGGAHLGGSGQDAHPGPGLDQQGAVHQDPVILRPALHLQHDPHIWRPDGDVWPERECQQEAGGGKGPGQLEHGGHGHGHGGNPQRVRDVRPPVRDVLETRASAGP